jgi:hypothetical protein
LTIAALGVGYLDLRYYALSIRITQDGSRCLSLVYVITNEKRGDVRNEKRGILRSLRKGKRISCVRP